MLIDNLVGFLCTDIFKVIKMTKTLYPLNVKTKHINFQLIMDL